MKRLLIFLVVLIATLTVGATANSDVLYTTFGSGPLSNTGWTIGYTDNQQVGAPFTPAINARLDWIDFAVFYSSGTNQLTVNLQTDNLGVPSGTIIESFSFTGLSGTPTIHTAYSLLHPLLTASTQYWVVLTAENLEASHLGWSLNTVGTVGVAFKNIIWTSWNYSPGNKTPAFDVYGTPLTAVPEPTTMLLLGSGLLGLVGLRRKFKK